MDMLAWVTTVLAAAAGLLAGGYVSVLIAWLPGSQPGLRRPAVSCLHAPAQPGTPQSGTQQPGTAQPGTAQPDTGQPGTAQPGTGQPGMRELTPRAVWLRLRRGCPECGRSLGRTWLAAELLTAALFAGLAIRFGPSPVLPAFCYLGAVGVALAFIDARHRRLPDFLTLPSYPIALVLLGGAALTTPGGARHFAGALIGLAAAWLLFFLQALIYPSGIGWGDVKLSGILGLYLGWLGAGALVAGLFLAYLAAAATGVALLATRRVSRKSQLAFGPFLLAGTLVVILISGLGIRR